MALLSSVAMETVSTSLLLGREQLGSGALAFPASQWGQPDPLLVYPVRLSPGDIWVSRRARRLTGLQTADHTDHTEVATVVFS